jgi:hypothetical protein
VEFGTTPMPVGKREAFASGSLFGVPTFQCVPASGRMQVNYAIFLVAVNPAWREVVDIEFQKKAIIVVGSGRERIHVPARDLNLKMVGAS